MLSDEQRQRLLRIAREAIEVVHAGRAPKWNAGDFDDDLRRPAGAFVTLKTKRDGDLRGCIGSIHPVHPLFHAVTSSAISAAFRDPRFLPVQPEELPHLGIEISVMGPIEIVASVDEIMVGRDGLIVSRGRQAGLLLPQVATEYGWERETFLSQTCVKAGLPASAWRRQDTRIERFAAEVFGE
ncbi:MAG TPA: AmmeMemoRadiSam system protein A [Thermoanaerobaculia bacterium]|nr:AmmeMemoRadiSam system protein A [Thermoanaerobaculia bacterium]